MSGKSIPSSTSVEESVAALIVGCLIFEEIIPPSFDHNHRIENAHRIIAAILKERLQPDQPQLPFEW